MLIVVKITYILKKLQKSSCPQTMTLDANGLVNIGQDINELQKRTSGNIGLIEQYRIT
jgi:hypothetical protein